MDLLEPQTAPSSCTVTREPPIAADRGTTVLTIVAPVDGALSIYAWPGGTMTPTTTTGIQSTGTTYPVTPSNATGPGNTASVTVNVQ
jgi:hypothetical protein